MRVGEKVGRPRFLHVCFLLIVCRALVSGYHEISDDKSANPPGLTIRIKS